MIGKWVKCEKCKEIIYKEELHENHSVCPNCGKHFRISARRRIAQIADDGTFEEIGKEIQTKAPLKFDEYLKKVETIKEKNKIDETVKCGICKIESEETVLAVMDGNFMMGSTDFCELHGDRNFGDDKSIIGGLAYIENTPVTIIAEQRGKNSQENMERNFGMPNPEGYRKALRLMKQAEKFARPVITFIDTPGAYPGYEVVVDKVLQLEEQIKAYKALKSPEKPFEKIEINFSGKINKTGFNYENNNFSARKGEVIYIAGDSGAKGLITVDGKQKVECLKKQAAILSKGESGLIPGISIEQKIAGKQNITDEERKMIKKSLDEAKIDIKDLKDTGKKSLGQDERLLIAKLLYRIKKDKKSIVFLD